MRNMEATTVARIFDNEFVCCFGIPKQLHTVQGRNFGSSLIIQLPRKRLVVHLNHLKHEHLQDWVIHQRARQNTPNDNLTLREKDKSYKRD